MMNHRIIRHRMGNQLASLFEEDMYIGHTVYKSMVLKLTIRIYFKKYESIGGPEVCFDADNNKHLAHPWQEADFREVCRRFEVAANGFWDHRFWLRTPDTYSGFNYVIDKYGISIKPNIRCRFQLMQVYNESDADQTVEIVNTFSPTFRSHSSLWKRKDSEYQVLQVPVVHEVGHCLGEDHVGGEGNKPINYLKPGTNDGSNIMGAGMALEEWNAYPWKYAMSEFTGIRYDQWKADTVRMEPKVASTGKSIFLVEYPPIQSKPSLVVPPSEAELSPENLIQSNIHRIGVDRVRRHVGRPTFPPAPAKGLDDLLPPDHLNRHSKPVKGLDDLLPPDDLNRHSRNNRRSLP